VEPFRSGPAQSAIQQNLSSRREQQIRPAHDLSDLHRDVVRHDGQLIGWYVVAPPDSKVAKVLARDKSLWAQP
jgi:hypothetical protein